MAKKNTAARKSGGASIAVIEESHDHDLADSAHETNGSSESHAAEPKAKRNGKPKAEPQSEGNFGVADVKKAATFANSIGGLDKAIALLQILKVAKEVQ